MADERIRVFLSSPMNTPEWRNLRESVIALFEHSALKDVFDLRYIENQSGDVPAEIYNPVAKDCHATVTLFNDEIRPDVKKELASAKSAGRPIIAFQEKGGKLSEEDKKFLKDHLYSATTVGSYSSMDDLFKKIKSGLIGLLARRLELRNDEEKLTAVLGEAMVKSLPDDKVLFMFAAFAHTTSQHQAALPLLSHAVASRPKDDELFIAKMALTATSNPCTLPPKEDLDRLAAVANTNDSAALVSASLKYRHASTDLPQTAKVADWLKKQSPAWTAVAKLDDLTRRLEDAVEFSVNEAVDAHRQIQIIAKSLSPIRVNGIGIFSWAQEYLEKRLEAVPVELNEADVPDVEACLNCMPRDDGEFVHLSSELGTLYDILLEQLYADHPGPEWCDFEFRGLKQTCGGCHGDVDETDDVFESLHSEDDRLEIE